VPAAWIGKRLEGHAMNAMRKIAEDASWDAMNEQDMHPFTEQDVIVALERLHAVLSRWHDLRVSDNDSGADLVECGSELFYAIGNAVLSYRTTCQRRKKELASEYRVLAKPAKYREY
jgi:hypothetical protein